MADLYASYAELAAAETLGVDYEIRTVPVAGATWTSIAIHGGGIEAGSGEMARDVGAGLMGHYEFAGIKPSGNTDLHITSTLFDEPTAVAMVGASLRTLSFHGFTGSSGLAETAIGGLDYLRIERVRDALSSAGFLVTDAEYEIAGSNPANICNENTSAAGVQLEMSLAQRQAFFPGGDTSRAMRDSGQRTADFDRYAAAVRSAFTGRGIVSLGSVNVSRYCILPVTAADVDLTANVSTGALAAGGSQFLALVARYADVSNMYLARIELTTAAVVNLTVRKRVGGTETLIGGTVNTGVSHVAGVPVWIRMQVSGTTIRAKAWGYSSPEPPWQVEQTDIDLSTGNVGMRSILSSANTNTLPIVASWGDFSDRIGNQIITVDPVPVNGVVKTIPAGAPVDVTPAAYIGL